MISVEEALGRLLAPLEALPPEQVSTADGIGRVLAEDLAARRTQPPFAVSAMDGYAVRAADLGRIPVSLRIVAEIPAGAGFGGTLGPGEAARHRPRRGDEPALALCAPPAADRDPLDRRRDRHAGRPDRAASDRQLERPGARRLRHRLRRRPGPRRQRPR